MIVKERHNFRAEAVARTKRHQSLCLHVACFTELESGWIGRRTQRRVIRAGGRVPG